MSTVSESNVNVYIWETRVEKDEEFGKSTVGHVALEIIGAEKNETNYVSFRPKNSLLVNPLTLFIPLQARNVSQLAEDVRLEGKTPDRIIALRLEEDQILAMKAKYVEIERKINNRELLYQLNPGLSVLSLFKPLTTKTGFQYLSACPFAGARMGDKRHISFFRFKSACSAHCATVAGDILSAGGIPISNNSLLPWKILPNNIGDQVIKKER